MNTLLLPTSIISLPSSSSWMIVGILYIRLANSRNHSREYTIRDGHVTRVICIIKAIRQWYFRYWKAMWKISWLPLRMIRESYYGTYIMNPEVREDIDTVKEVCRYCRRYLRGDERWIRHNLCRPEFGIWAWLIWISSNWKIRMW